MTIEEKEMGRYLDGLIILHHVINTEDDINKASDVVHDLLLGYDVVKDFKDEYKNGYKDVEDLYVNFPKENQDLFNSPLENQLKK